MLPSFARFCAAARVEYRRRQRGEADDRKIRRRVVGSLEDVDDSVVAHHNDRGVPGFFVRYLLYEERRVGVRTCDVAQVSVGGRRKDVVAVRQQKVVFYVRLRL